MTSSGDDGAGGSNTSGGPTFRVRPNWLAQPPTILHSEYRVFPVGKAAGSWC